MNGKGLAVVLLGTGLAWGGPGPLPVAGLRAEYRFGQVFLTWREAPVPARTTFAVYLSRHPIVDEATLAAAERVCRWIEPRSAEDWTRDKGNYGKGRVEDAATGEVPPVPSPLGHIVKEGAERLDPTSGLHVHTVSEDEPEMAYYAVTVVLNGREDRDVRVGENALRAPVAQRHDRIRPVWQGKGEGVAPGTGKGKPLHLQLHAKGNRPACSYIVFGDATHAWREGIAFMFDVSVANERVTLIPSNTLYTGRFLQKGTTPEAEVRGIWTMWYGASDRVPEPDQIERGTPTDYSERRLLFEIEWVKHHLQTDPTRTYCTGSSMGGCGGMSFAFRHPEIFAAVSAHVPIVAYNTGDPEKGRALGWHDNTFRLAPFCGSLSLACSDGMPLSTRLDSTAFALSHPQDLPFLIIANGRQDASIPWHNNPPLYRALQTMRHGCLVAWNNGEHPGVEDLLPPDFREWKTARLARFALNRSYPAFSRCSRDGNPGNGDNNDGDVEGTMNRGLNWGDPSESAERYDVLISYDLDPAHLPLSVDVTPRRCQAFRPAPGQTCSAVNIDSAGETIQSLQLKADAFGLVTFPGFRLTRKGGNRLVLTQ